MRIIPVLTWLVVVGCFSIPSLARADAATELEQLRAEVALLKMKLDSAEKKLAAGEGEAIPHDLSAGRSGKLKPIANLTEILKTFPEDIQPDRDGNWSTTALNENVERLKYSVWGTPFQSELKIFRIEVTENRELQRDGDASPHLIEIQFARSVLEHEGKEILQDIETIKIYADEGRARRARKLEIGDEVRVRGNLVTIEKMGYNDMRTAKGWFNIYLRDVDIPGITK